jgi:hypothetical protein
MVLPRGEVPEQSSKRLASQAEPPSRPSRPLLQPTDHELRKVGPMPHEERREGSALPLRDRPTTCAGASAGSRTRRASH